MIDVKALTTFLESCPESYCSLIDVTGCQHWCLYDNDTVYWKDSGGVYSGYLFEGIHKCKLHSIANLDTQQRWTTTGVFDNSKQISYEEFEDLYIEEM